MIDVTILGGGIVGISLARELSRYNLSLLLIEKQDDLALGATAHSSGVVKSAVHALPGTLKSVLLSESRELWRRVIRDLQIPTTRHATLMVAGNADERDELTRRMRTGQANGERNLSLLSPRQVHAREPHLTKGIYGAMLDENSFVIDPVFYSLALAENACENGLEVKLGETVTGLKSTSKSVTITTEKKGKSQTYRTRFMINASGLDVPNIGNLLGINHTRGRHQKGQYLVLDQGTRLYNLDHSIETVGGTDALGFGVHRTPYGSLLLGPVQTKPTHRHDLSPELANLREVLRVAHSLLPKLPVHHIFESFAGIWEEETDGDFKICFESDFPRILSLSSLGALGFSASPAMGEYVAGLLQGAGLDLPLKEDFSPTRRRRFPHLRAELSRDLLREVGDENRVICSCSPAREADVRYHLSSPLPPVSIEGLARRLGINRLSCHSGACLDFLRSSLAQHHSLDADQVKVRDSLKLREEIKKEDLRKDLLSP